MKEYIMIKETGNAPITVAELVRCKNCKNADYGTDEDGDRFMKCIGSVKCYGGTTPDFFCADGIAKDINVPGKEGL